MAQTFSVVTTLIDGIAEVVSNRVQQKQAAKAKKEADEEEVRDLLHLSARKTL